MVMGENGIEDITFLVSPGGDVFPDFQIDTNERTFKGFSVARCRKTSKKKTYSAKRTSNWSCQKWGIPLPEDFDLLDQ